MAVIRKKVWPEYFAKILSGEKGFEVRLADFDVSKGDVLVLEEWDNSKKKYTGRKIEAAAEYVFRTKGQAFWPGEEVEKHGFQIIQLKPKYPKLVRDLIPEIIKAKEGIDVSVRTLEDDAEYLAALLQKLVEESAESKNAAADELSGELADVFEVICAILKIKNLAIEDIIALQKSKRDERGGFDKRILMLGSSPT